jgi:hypothetical protein
MTETLETPNAAAAPAPIVPVTEESSAAVPTAEIGSPFFADLVRAHFAWERALAATNGDAAQLDRLERAFHDKLDTFAAAEGEIVQVYWCVRKPSAVALTEKRQTRMQRLLGEQEIRLHRVSNWLMPRLAQKLDDLLHDCDELAIRSAEILRGTPKRIALRSTYEIESHVLAFLERTNGKPTEREIEQFVKDARQGIDAARACYENASDKVARMVYVSGMMAGVALLVPLAVLAGLALWIFGALHLNAMETRTFFACLAAGALGAFVSVLSRMGSRARFGLDPEIGRRALFVLGTYRPAVGAIFGVALYFLLQSSLLQVQSRNTFATLVVAAFLGGFSERFVKVMLHGAEGAMGAGSGNVKWRGSETAGSPSSGTDATSEGGS